MYKEYADIYDLIYSFKDYKKEVKKIKKLIKKYKSTDGSELLDIACGTGEHLKYLEDSFICTGVDINEGIMNVAKNNVKGATFKQADMVNFDLNKKFNIIISLFSSIGYLNYHRLNKGVGFVIHRSLLNYLLESYNFSKRLTFRSPYGRMTTNYWLSNLSSTIYKWFFAYLNTRRKKDLWFIAKLIPQHLKEWAFFCFLGKNLC